MKRSAFLLTGVGLALAAGALFAVGYRLTTATVPVLTASTAIPADTPVQADELTTTRVPRHFAEQAGLITDPPSALVGHYLSVSTVPGEPISANMISTTNDLQALLNQYTAAQHEQGVLMDFTANTALANLVEPGQTIAITVTPQGQGAVPQLYPVYVLSVSVPQPSNNSSLGGSSSSSKVIYLFIPMSEYDAVSAAILSGSAHVVFLPSGMTLPNVSSPSSAPSTSTGPSASSSNTTSGTNSNPTAPVMPGSTHISTSSSTPATPSPSVQHKAVQPKHK
ncbi:SAF domain-containing protein [Alicyclobacillus fructus]|uniref:SAF domain-containing protein n=1 Tax=Alicyclobacillus fructus TaxID=2816082 RepID=UPI001A8F5A8E|nr:SAF domain-containing protein [Alicyclobacillus fructus]